MTTTPALPTAPALPTGSALPTAITDPAAPPVPVLGPAPGTPFHRLGRTGRHRWWLHPVGTLFVLAGLFLAVNLIAFGHALVAAVAGRPAGADGVPSFGTATETWLTMLMLATATPLVLFAVRWIQGRPAGSVSSVTGRLRVGWLGTCLLVAVPAAAVLIAGGTALLAVTDPDSAGLDAGFGTVGLPALVTGLLLTLLLVPVQAAGEEYFCRGWLLQAVGAYTRGPVLPIAVSAVVFALAHGIGTPWGFADLVVFGALAGWLAVRTGGLEAPLALHIGNNVVGFALAVVTGQLSLDETAADMPWQFAVVDIAVMIAYAAVVARLARRKAVATVTPVGPVTPVQP